MGKPGGSNVPSSITESIGYEKGTGGTETSKYPQEEKTKCDSASSGERTRKSLNRAAAMEFGVWTDVIEIETRRRAD